MPARSFAAPPHVSFSNVVKNLVGRLRSRMTREGNNSLLQKEKVARVSVTAMFAQQTCLSRSEKDEVDPLFKKKLLCAKEPHQSSLRSDSFPKGKP